MRYGFKILLFAGLLNMGVPHVQGQSNKDSTVSEHSISFDVLRSIVRNSIEFTYEYQPLEQWSFFTVLGGHFSTPGEDFYGQEGILYIDKSEAPARSLGAVLDSRKSKGIEWRGGTNWHLTSSFLLSPVLGYRYSYYNRKLVCYGNCPPRIGHGDPSPTKKDLYSLTIESRKTHIIKLDIIGRWRWSIMNRIFTEVWIGGGIQYGHRYRNIHEIIPQHFDDPIFSEGCKVPGCTPKKNREAGFGPHAMAGIKIGYQFNVNK